jgi:protein TonB
VTAALRSNWRRPPLGNVREPLTVMVAFDILRTGAVRNPRILESSGVPSLDRSALRAVVDAQPLPALPRGLSADVVPARFEFTWSPGDS